MDPELREFVEAEVGIESNNNVFCLVAKFVVVAYADKVDVKFVVVG